MGYLQIGHKIFTVLGGAKRLIVNVFLLFGVVAYSAVGGLLFYELEYDESLEVQRILRETVAECTSGILTDDAEKVEQIADTCFLPFNNTIPWSYVGGFVLAYSSVITMGYGNLKPITSGGRLFYIFYCLVGIPLGLVFLANLGKFMEKAVGYIMDAIHNLIKKWKKRKKKVEPLEEVSTKKEEKEPEDDEEEEEEEEEFQIGGLFFLFLLFVYIALGVIWMNLLNNNGVIESLFHNFNAMTAMDANSFYDLRGYMLPIALIYVTVGLSFVTVAIGILGKYLNYLQSLGYKLKGSRMKKVKFGTKDIRVKDLLYLVSDEMGLDRTTVDSLDLDKLLNSKLNPPKDPPEVPKPEPEPEGDLTLLEEELYRNMDPMEMGQTERKMMFDGNAADIFDMRVQEQFINEVTKIVETHGNVQVKNANNVEETIKLFAKKDKFEAEINGEENVDIKQKENDNKLESKPKRRSPQTEAAVHDVTLTREREYPQERIGSEPPRPFPQSRFAEKKYANHKERLKTKFVIPSVSKRVVPHGEDIQKRMTRVYKDAVCQTEMKILESWIRENISVKSTTTGKQQDLTIPVKSKFARRSASPRPGLQLIVDQEKQKKENLKTGKKNTFQQLSQKPSTSRNKQEMIIVLEIKERRENKVQNDYSDTKKEQTEKAEKEELEQNSENQSKKLSENKDDKNEIGEITSSTSRENIESEKQIGELNNEKDNTQSSNDLGDQDKMEERMELEENDNNNKIISRPIEKDESDIIREKEDLREIEESVNNTAKIEGNEENHISQLLYEQDIQAESEELGIIAENKGNTISQQEYEKEHVQTETNKLEITCEKELNTISQLAYAQENVQTENNLENPAENEGNTISQLTYAQENVPTESNKLDNTTENEGNNIISQPAYEQDNVQSNELDFTTENEGNNIISQLAYEESNIHQRSNES